MLEIKVENGKLTIAADVSKPGEISKSGKSMILATTNGFYTVPGTDIRVGLNVIKGRR